MQPTKFHRLNDVLGAEKAIAALLILNGPQLSEDLLDLVWPKSNDNAVRPIICADGGANLLSRSRVMRDRSPTHIVGDLDSLKPDVRRKYEARGTEVVTESSENSNDFQKAVKLCDKLAVSKELPIVVIGGHGGRMDQTLGNLNTLHCAAENNRDMYWLDSSNAVLALSAGRHKISIDASKEGPICGLIPVGMPVRSVSTEGLKWNLDSTPLSFGTNGLISTSNELVEQDALVDTSDPVLWTTELRLR